jgi:hypothetical protein
MGMKKRKRGKDEIDTETTTERKIGKEGNTEKS